MRFTQQQIKTAMAELTKPLGPVPGKSRIDSLDILRGIAVLGILLMNIVGFAFIWQANGNPTIQGGADGPNIIAYIATNMFFEGTMRAIFSMLFGVGMVLMTTRMEKRGGGIEVADIYYRRTIWLLIFGLIHGYLLLWPGDILYSYGLFGLFLFPFRKTSPKKLIFTAAGLILFGIGLYAYQYTKHLDNYESYLKAEAYNPDNKLPEEIKEGKEQWASIVENFNPNEDRIQKNVKSMHSGYIDLVLTLAPINRMVQTKFTYDYNPWDVLPMMLLGIALFRLKVITAELRTRTYLLMMLIGYGVGLPINYYETTTVLKSGFSVISIFETGLTYPIGRLALAIGHISLIMIFCKWQKLQFLKKSLAAVGRMALTNYILQSIICVIIFTGIGFSLFGQLQRYEIYFIVFAIWIFQLIYSPIWLKFFRFGPLEWLWRTLTYRKMQTFRHTA